MKTNMTIGEKYSPAMEITDQAKADAYFEECVQHKLKHLRAKERPDSDIAPKTLRQKAESIERQNLGYYADYYDSETRERIKRLFGSDGTLLALRQAAQQPGSAKSTRTNYEY